MLFEEFLRFVNFGYKTEARLPHKPPTSSNHYFRTLSTKNY